MSSHLGCDRGLDPCRLEERVRGWLRPGSSLCSSFLSLHNNHHGGCHSAMPHGFICSRIIQIETRTAWWHKLYILTTRRQDRLLTLGFNLESLNQTQPQTKNQSRAADTKRSATNSRSPHHSAVFFITTTHRHSSGKPFS